MGKREVFEAILRRKRPVSCRRLALLFGGALAGFRSFSENLTAFLGEIAAFFDSVLKRLLPIACHVAQFLACLLGVPLKLPAELPS